MILAGSSVYLRSKFQGDMQSSWAAQLGRLPESIGGVLPIHVLLAYRIPEYTTGSGVIPDRRLIIPYGRGGIVRISAD